MLSRSRIKLFGEPVMSVSRSALKADRLVYVLTVNKLMKYPNGRSSIVYIGTTKTGIRRVASSIAYRVESLLNQTGIKHVQAYILTYKGRSGVQGMWNKLERAALVVFKLTYGDKPLLNKKGKNFWPKDEFKHFSHRRLLSKIKEFESVE